MDQFDLSPSASFMNRLFKWGMIGFAFICFFLWLFWVVADEARGNHQIPPLSYKPVPGMIFSQIIMDAPSASIGYKYWAKEIHTLCAAQEGNLEVKHQHMNFYGLPVRTVVINCWVDTSKTKT